VLVFFTELCKYYIYIRSISLAICNIQLLWYETLGGDRRKMRKGIVILAAIVVITISAAVVAAAVANLSDDPGNSQQIKGLTQDLAAQSQMTALDAAGDVIMEYLYLEMPFDTDLNRRIDLGHVVHFTPAGAFIVEGVVINGTYDNESGFVPFALELRDENGGLLYELTDISVAYFSTEPGLTVIEIPPIKIDGEFSVTFYSRTSVAVGAYVGASNNMSFVVARGLGMSPALSPDGKSLEWAISVAGREA
jgi:hypothetical protein